MSRTPARKSELPSLIPDTNQKVIIANLEASRIVATSSSTKDIHFSRATTIEVAIHSAAIEVIVFVLHAIGIICYCSPIANADLTTATGINEGFNRDLVGNTLTIMILLLSSGWTKAAVPLLSA